MVYCKIAISISAGTSTDDRWVVGRPKIRCANSPSGCEGKWVSNGAAIEGLILRLGGTTPKQARIFGFDAGRRPRPAAFSPEKIVALFWLFTSQKCESLFMPEKRPSLGRGTAPAKAVACLRVRSTILLSRDRCHQTGLGDVWQTVRTWALSQGQGLILIQSNSCRIGDRGPVCISTCWFPS